MKRRITIKEAAALAGESVKQTRRRLKLMDEMSGGRVLSTLDGKRGRGCKLLVNTVELMKELEADDTGDMDLSRIRFDLESLRDELAKQREAHLRLRREVSRNRKRQEIVNKAQLAAIQAIETLAHTVGND